MILVVPLVVAQVYVSQIHVHAVEGTIAPLKEKLRNGFITGIVIGKKIV